MLFVNMVARACDTVAKIPQLGLPLPLELVIKVVQNCGEYEENQENINPIDNDHHDDEEHDTDCDEDDEDENDESNNGRTKPPL